jgi:choline dehydrogenase-like flavoprotein
MVYTRCSADDYDWIAREVGDKGWTWDNMLPWFLKNERWVSPVDQRDTSGQYDPSVHSTKGVNPVSLPNVPQGIDGRVIETTEVLKDLFPFNLDTNSGHPMGLGWAQSTIGNGERSTARRSYLTEKVLNRKNLHVLINARVTRVLQSGRNTTFRTIEATHTFTGSKFTLTAAKDVILSAGAVGTPVILLHSGIGDSTTLSSLGIKSRLHLPSVGQNLTDHVITRLIWTVNSTATWEKYTNNRTEEQLARDLWMKTREGVMGNAYASHIAWARMSEDEIDASGEEDPSSGPGTPHLEMLIANGYRPPRQPSTGNFLTLSPAILTPTSRGSVSITSTDPFSPPSIDPSFLSTPFDIAAMRAAVRLTLKFALSPTWSDYLMSPLNFPPELITEPENDDLLDQFIRNNSGNVQHPVSTCMMTRPDADYGCVNPDFRVKGAVGLMIVDASVFPLIPSGHTQAPVYAMAERVADMIKREK